MKVLFAKAGAPRISPVFAQEKRFPIGIGFLISVLREAGHEVYFIDNYLHPRNFIEEGLLQENGIDVLGVHVDSICFDEAEAILKGAEKLRKKGRWGGKIVVGGPHASVMPETIPEYVDHVVIGEGEKVILKIIDGASERVIGDNPIAELDSLPMPAYDLAARLPYDTTAPFIDETPVFSMNTSRGCPFECTFCSVGSVWGRRYHCFSANRIIEDIKFLRREYHAAGIYFREDNFTLRKDRVKAFCEGLLSNGVNIHWMCETRVDTLDKDLLVLMKRAGCAGLYIGTESGSQRMLDFMKKGITIDQIKEVFQWCGDLGLRTLASFVVGAPTETSEERKETVEFARNLGATVYGFNVFVGIPRSFLYDYVLANKLYEHIDRRGLIYLEGHDAMVDEFYDGNPLMKIPRPKGVREHLYALAKRVRRGIRKN
ncbi:MAG: radical SAM protein [Candidatus Abyssobacteria bacterium SURF_17]|uniref:Radical SAM protein n=1 Tax=Candidatus Abyssobacteria bacterium SURF_17 TaxID=2093361 RepID=A0A419F3H9_9BACT|nr:MAG: radical SAM protein [Candidatus Abyssubacteria bacterium SURF_17]